MRSKIENIIFVDIYMTLWTSQFMLNYCLVLVITVRVSSNASSEQCEPIDVFSYEISIFITIVKRGTRKIAPCKTALQPIPPGRLSPGKLVPGNLLPKYFPRQIAPRKITPCIIPPENFPLKNCPRKSNLSHYFILNEQS